MEIIGCCSLHTSTNLYLDISTRYYLYKDKESKQESRRIDKPKIPYLQSFNLSLKTGVVNMHEFPNIDIDSLDQRRIQWEGHAMPCWSPKALLWKYWSYAILLKGPWEKLRACHTRNEGIVGAGSSSVVVLQSTPESCQNKTNFVRKKCPVPHWKRVQDYIDVKIEEL